MNKPTPPEGRIVEEDIPCFIKVLLAAISFITGWPLYEVFRGGSQ